ncbi:hypothetical protein ACXHVK_003160 [Morganella morganii]
MKSCHRNRTKPGIEQPPNVDQSGVITGFIIIGTQIGTHRNSLYDPAYRTITGQTTSLCHSISSRYQDNDRTGGSGIGGSRQNAKSHSG